MFLLLRMRRNAINFTSGFKMDLKFGFLVPKNIYDVKFCHKKRHFDPFLPDLTILQRAWGFLAWNSRFSPKVRGKIFFYNSNPLKALPCTKRHVLTHERSKSVEGSDLCRWARTPPKKQLKRDIPWQLWVLLGGTLVAWSVPRSRIHAQKHCTKL